MEFFKVLQKRRSIRRFANKPVEREKILRLLEAAFLSPSSHNHRPWYFYVVTNPKLLDKLSKSKNGAQGLKNAKVAVVVTCDQTKSDVWVEDCSIAAQHINLAAVDLGLGSFWVQIRNRWHSSTLTAEKYVQQLLNIPDHHRVCCIIGIGYKAYEKPEHSPHIEEDKITWYD